MAFKLPVTITCNADCPVEITVVARNRDEANELARAEGWQILQLLATNALGQQRVQAWGHLCPAHHGATIKEWEQ